MQERDGLAQQLADAITITIQISPGSRSEVGAALGASDDIGESYTKAEADYRRGAVDADKVCGSCDHFLSDDACEIVSGVIRENDVCNYWSGEENAD